MRDGESPAITTRRYLARSTLLTLVAVLGCSLTSHEEFPVLPVAHSVVREQLTVYSDFKLPRHHRLLNELVAQRSDITQRLQLPVSDEPIHVYLFDSSQHYRAYMESEYPALPRRRAFFVESDTRLAVYAHWGDHVADDLRHEVAHGYLHAVVRNLPLWLDEGLAEYFEVARGRSGLNWPHVDTLWEHYDANRWLPRIDHLEMLESAADMTLLEYAESWLWVHLLLETTPQRRAMLQNYLARLRIAGEAEPLSQYLRKEEPAIERALLQHLHQLQQRQHLQPNAAR